MRGGPCCVVQHRPVGAAQRQLRANRLQVLVVALALRGPEIERLADLSGAVLEVAYLVDANLQGADLG